VRPLPVCWPIGYTHRLSLGRFAYTPNASIATYSVALIITLKEHWEMEAANGTSGGVLR
jgi:hypothetical protein